MILKWYRNRVISDFMKGRKAYEDEDHTKLCAKAERIKSIANRHMKSGEMPNGIPKKSHVVVPYEDLLRIWDIADKIKWGD
jgi:hypothetical protein